MDRLILALQDNGLFFKSLNDIFKYCIIIHNMFCIVMLLLLYRLAMLITR